MHFKILEVHVLEKYPAKIRQNILKPDRNRILKPDIRSVPIQEYYNKEG